MSAPRQVQVHRDCVGVGARGKARAGGQAVGALGIREGSGHAVPHCRRLRRAAGFSLLEVIAAVLLLAITFASLMRVAGSSIDLTRRSAERSAAAMWARSLLDSAFVLEPIRPGRSSGRFDARYSWQLDVQPWTIPGAAMPTQPAAMVPLRLFKLDLDVLWRSGRHDYRARFSTLRLAAPLPTAGR